MTSTPETPTQAAPHESALKGLRVSELRTLVADPYAGSVLAQVAIDGGTAVCPRLSGRPPVRSGVSIGDALASLYGVIGARMAMHHLNVNKGTGQYIDVALYEAAYGVKESLNPESSLFKYIRERLVSSLPGISPSNT